MSCISLKGIGTNCETSLAGIKKIWIAESDNVKIVPTFDEATGRLSSHVATLTIAESTKPFFPYSFAKQTGSLTSTITIDEANGVRYYTNEIALQFNKMEAEKHLEIEALAAGELVVIVLDNNGKYWAVGYDNYVSATAAGAQSGQAFGDLNGYTTTMSAMSAYLPFEVEKFEDTYKDNIDDTSIIK